MTPDELGAYLARTLPEDRKETVERHLVACDRCRADLLAASHPVGRAGSRRWLRVAIPAAAAAVIALVFIVPGDTPTVDPLTPNFRSESTEGVRVFAALSPEDGAEVAADSVRFEWRSEGPEARYSVTMTNEVGDVAWQQSTTDTVIVLSPDVTVIPGARYFWRVDALLQGARSSTTGFRSFVIIDP